MRAISLFARQAFRALPSGIQLRVKKISDERAIDSRIRSAQQAIYKDAEWLSDHCLTNIATRAEWEAQRSEIREALIWMLGVAPTGGATVNGQCTGVVDKVAYRIEKWLLKPSSGRYLTANLYLPHATPAPHPCILYQNGHWPSLDGAKTGFQDRYLWYPENGFALLVLDPMGFGEIPGIHHGTNRLNRWDWLSKGYTPAGVEISNAICALDWLQSRPEIDADRIGATGISGGGVMTQYLAALDERVKVVVPSCSTFTIGNQVSAGLVAQQCDCTFYPNVFGLDFPEVLALIAPRPLLILGGCKDPIFPPAGFRAAFERTQRVYRLYDDGTSGEQRIRLLESNAGHTDTPQFLEETRAWMCHWLQPSVARQQSRIPPQALPLPPAVLRVTETAPVDAVNGYIDEIWLQPPQLQLPTTATEAEARRDSLMHILQSRVFRWFPENHIPFRIRKRPVTGGYAGEIAEFGEYLIDSEPDVPVVIRLLKPLGALEPVPTVLWVKAASEDVAFPDIDEFLPLVRTHALAILTPRFADRQLTAAEYAFIERSAALLGRSIASMQIWDALRTISWLREEHRLGVGGVTVYGRGEYGIVALYAALLDVQVSHVVLRDPPTSHRAGPPLPTILRDTDLEEIAGLLAPRAFTVLGSSGGGFSITREWFRLACASEKFGFQPTMAAAVQDTQTEQSRNHDFQPC